MTASGGASSPAGRLPTGRATTSGEATSAHASTSVPGVRVVLDARPLQEPDRAPLTVANFERYVKGLAPDYQMMSDLSLTKNVIPEAKTVAAQRGIRFPT